MKICAKCDGNKPLGEFYRQAKRPDGKHPWCKECCRDYNREYARRPDARERRLAWRRANETYDRGSRVAYLYGLSVTDYEGILKAQSGRCAICRTDRPGGRHDTWHVDHDRSCCPRAGSCGRCVRGLLCNNCNQALGLLGDDPEVIRSAASYVQMNRQLKLVIA